MRAALERSWYSQGAWWWLRPFAVVFGWIAALRRRAYLRGWLRCEEMPVPVLVVGNITVGGSGKTPLTIELVERLQARGRRVGVVARGYGAKSARYPLTVQANTPASEAGDEPVMIAQRTGACVAVDPRRPRAARYLIERQGVEFVLADDGLQHYALARDGEIGVTDARRGWGNGWLLPAGPLREPPWRLDCVDLSLWHGRGHDFWLEGDRAVCLQDGRSRELSEFAGTRVHAIAGIGDPDRFFDMLRGWGLHVHAHAMPDHHDYHAAEIRFDDDLPVLMTDKDAVKCQRFSDARHWRVTTRVVLAPAAEAGIERLLDRLCALAPGRSL